MSVSDKKNLKIIQQGSTLHSLVHRSHGFAHCRADQISLVVPYLNPIISCFRGLSYTVVSSLKVSQKVQNFSSVGMSSEPQQFSWRWAAVIKVLSNDILAAAVLPNISSALKLFRFHLLPQSCTRWNGLGKNSLSFVNHIIVKKN